VLAKEEPAQENCNDRIDVVVDADHGNGQPFQSDDVSAVADDGTEDHQVNDCADAAPAPSRGMRPRKQRWNGKGETGRKLLHGAGDDGMGGGLMTALQNGAQAPGGTTQLQQQEAAQQRTAEAFLHDLWRNQKRGSGEAYQHCDQSGAVQALAAGNQRIHADHPERRNGDEHRRQAAGDPLLGIDQTSGAASDDDDAEQCCVPELAAGGEVRFGKIREGQQDDSGDGVAQAHKDGRLHGFDGDADTEIRGAPEKAHGCQRQIGLKLGMTLQNSG